MSITAMKQFSSYTIAAEAKRPTRLTSASTALFSDTPVNRTDYLSGVLVVNLNASTLKAAGTAKFVVKAQHSSVSSAGFSDYAFEDKTTSATLRVGTTTSTATQSNKSAVGQYGLNLAAAKKYIRVSLTPTVTVGSSVVTNLAAGSAVFVFGGSNSLPI